MSKKIGLLCEQFLNFSGEDSLFGGGERWWYDFTVLLKNIGYDVDCYQFSYPQWTGAKRYKNMTIKGLGNIKTNDYSKNLIEGMNKFHELTQNCDGIFYLSMNLSQGLTKKPNICVSHGLMFDGISPGQTGYKPYEALDQFKKWIRCSTHAISVDTNSIKLMQVYYPQIANKFTYIPNYVDINVFKYKEKLIKDKFIVLFPRRLQWCRGYTTMMRASDILLEKYNDIEIRFVGRGNKQEEDHFNHWYKNKDKNKIKHTYYEMPDMWRAYEEPHIMVASTIMAEGSSLSVLEGLATGTVPIVSIVGGLQDIIMDGINGLSIMPDDAQSYNENEANATHLVSAIEKLYKDRVLLETLRENGLRMREHFSKKRWERQISEVVKKVYGEP